MNKSKKYLITTPINELLPKNKNADLVFVSENIIKKLNLNKANYKNIFIGNHNKKNFSYEDYKYITELSDRILINLASKLNKIHNKNYSLRFWKILVGSYAKFFTTIFFDKWYLIKDSINFSKIDYVNFIKINNSELIAYEMHDFGAVIENDYWNQKIYQNVISNIVNKKKIKTAKYNYKKKFYLNKDNISFFRKIFFLIFNKLFINKYYKFFIFLPYIGVYSEFKLNFTFKQFPIFFNNIFNLFFFKKKLELSKNKINIELRKILNKDFIYKNQFEKHLFDNLVNEIPTVFVENFDDFKKINNIINFPQKPKKIFLSNGIIWSSAIAFYVAKHVDSGSKLIVGQHGGTYGISKFNWQEDYEIDISDKFISYGWTNTKNSKKIIKFYYLLKNIEYKKKCTDINNYVISIILPVKKNHTPILESCVSRSHDSKFFSFIESYLLRIKKEVRKNFILKFANNNIYNSQIIREYSHHCYKKSFKDVCLNSNLIVHTCNSTSILEALNANVPSLILWNKEVNIIRDDAKKYFDILYNKKILYYDTTKAAKFTESLLKYGINKWWYSNNVQTAVNAFCRKYARRCSPIKKIKGLNKIIIS